jgi:hypothetical protein
MKYFVAAAARPTPSASEPELLSREQDKLRACKKDIPWLAFRAEQQHIKTWSALHVRTAQRVQLPHAGTSQFSSPCPLQNTPYLKMGTSTIQFPNLPSCLVVPQPILTLSAWLQNVHERS